MQKTCVTICVTAKRKDRRQATEKTTTETRKEECVTAKRKGRRKAEEKTRKEGKHLGRKPHEGDKLKLT